MSVSYEGLLNILREKGIQKKTLIEELNISSATIAKMGKGENISMDVLSRICQYLDCNIGDVVSFENRNHS